MAQNIKIKKENNISTTVDNVKFIRAGQECEHGITKRSFHRFSINKEISREEAKELQTQLGYHPQGYGFDSFDQTDSLTTWECYHSCD